MHDVEDDVRLAVLTEGGNRFAGLRVQRVHRGSGGGVDHAVGVDHAAVTEDEAFAASAANRVGDVERPEQVAVGSVERIHPAARIGDVHRPVHDHRRGLITDAVDDAVLKEPTRRQGFDVGFIDAVERGETAAGEIQVVQHPVCRRRGRRALRGNPWRCHEPAHPCRDCDCAEPHGPRRASIPRHRSPPEARLECRPARHSTADRRFRTWDRGKRYPPAEIRAPMAFILSGTLFGTARTSKVPSVFRVKLLRNSPVMPLTPLRIRTP